jgi:hypothetical protein
MVLAPLPKGDWYCAAAPIDERRHWRLRVPPEWCLTPKKIESVYEAMIRAALKARRFFVAFS